jgi:hypothetical protein
VYGIRAGVTVYHKLGIWLEELFICRPFDFRGYVDTYVNANIYLIA